MKTELKKAAAKRSILIIDDHPVFRAGLSRTIHLEKDLTVCAEAADASEGLKKIEELDPEMAIIDLSMEGMNGIDLIKSIRARWANIRLLVLSTHKESLYAERSLKAGANGYIMKRENGENLLMAIRTVLQGRTYLSAEVNQSIIDKLTHPRGPHDDPESILSERELETFRLIGQGLGSRQIAEALHISMKTVEAHREHMRAKFDLESNYQLVQKAIQWVHQQNHIV